MQANNQFESASAEKRPLSKRGKENLAKRLKKKEERITAKIANKREKRKKQKQKLELVEREKMERGELVEGVRTLVLEKDEVMGEREVEMSGAMFEGYRENRSIYDGDDDEDGEKEDQPRNKVGDGYGDE
ncbi:hypothetical protein BHYA_0181g00090 [Botrytis hyacinthi]|uniref:Uncharacterized protein n=1 Tax=Botrytis hyacinthi TaxID=278943 RepID=A0A4Z1GI22_9HELO|nr:hypothetical protein BHYA_0181g00090 [Botrytis hyacinthi]